MHTHARATFRTIFPCRIYTTSPPRRCSRFLTSCSSIPKWWANSCQIVSATTFLTASKYGHGVSIFSNSSLASSSMGIWYRVMISGNVIPTPYPSPRAESGIPLYSPSNVSSSPKPSASRSSWEGSSSTSRATFCIFSRTHWGSCSYPFSTSFSNSLLSIRVWYTSLMTKEKKIDTIEKLPAMVAEGFADVESKFEEVNLTLGHVQDDVRSLRYDVKELKSDVGEIKRDIT